MTTQEYQEMKINNVLERLSQSKFRSRFHLGLKEKEYIKEKGWDTIQKHAEEFIAKRLALKEIPNDGKQTPMRGHPVFIAQHATATCCRGCLWKWHKIAKDKELTKEEQAYIVKVILTWLQKEWKENRKEKI